MPDLYMFDSTERQLERVSSALTDFVSTTFQLGTYMDAPFDLRVSASCTPHDKQAVGYLHGIKIITYREVYDPHAAGGRMCVLYIVPGVIWKLSNVGTLPKDILNKLVNGIAREKPISMRDGLLYFRNNHIQSDAVITMWCSHYGQTPKPWYAEDQERVFMPQQRDPNEIRRVWVDKFDDTV